MPNMDMSEWRNTSAKNYQKKQGPNCFLSFLKLGGYVLGLAIQRQQCQYGICFGDVIKGRVLHIPVGPFKSKGMFADHNMKV